MPTAGEPHHQVPQALGATASHETATLGDPQAAFVPFAATLRFASDAGTFIADSARAMVSSARKQAYRGTLIRPNGTHLPAIAVLFASSDPTFYAAEAASLARNQLLCVGPEAYALTARVALEGRQVPVVVEEDAGTDLDMALFTGAPIAGPGGEGDEEPAPLHPLGTRERDLENKKIFYDILDQVERLHAHGLYHRDVRAANICVRRFGSSPQDIHATLIDYELVTSYEGTDVPATAERYNRALFDALPRLVSPAAHSEPPTSFVRDVGYLAALHFELWEGRSIAEADPAKLAFGTRPFFQYTSTGTVAVRRLDREQDLDPLARELGLTPLDSTHLFDARMVAYAREHIAPGGFLDERGRGILNRDASFLRDAPMDDLARDIVYQAWREACRTAGRVPEYASFEEQPPMLQQSNIDQIRDIPLKVRALGYRIVPLAEAGPDARVTAFSPEEIESLAYLEHRRWWQERLHDGWIAGFPRDDEHRIHPDLIPYDELSEQSREYDRVAARGIIGILEQLGFAVTR